MAENSAIEWTDHTWTPVVGCDAVSPGCANCYAATMAARLEAMGQEKYRGLATRVGGKGKWTGKVTFHEPDLVKPLTVRKASRWFLTSMGDIGHSALSMEQVAEVFGIMAVAGAMGAFGHRWTGKAWVDGKGPHTFMVLTKRPERLAQLLADSRFRKLVAQAACRWAHDQVPASQIADGIYPFDLDTTETPLWPLPNVLIGCTAEDQIRADERRPHMAGIAAAGWRTFVSYEPALGPVDWIGWEFLAQIISGGESGPKARPPHPDWFRAARDWSAGARVPYLHKQNGEFREFDTGSPTIDVVEADDEFETAPNPADLGAIRPSFVALDGRHFLQFADVPEGLPVRLIERVGKKAAGRLLDGLSHDAIPSTRTD